VNGTQISLGDPPGQLMTLAMAKAADAASPPTSTVCQALRNGRCVVNRPLMKPNKNGSSGFAVGQNQCVFVHSSLRMSRRIRHFPGIELESTAVKVDGYLHVLAIAVTIGVFLTAWIFEFRPSMVALVMRCSQ
jgi:hypothetical protein